MIEGGGELRAEGRELRTYALTSKPWSKSHKNTTLVMLIEAKHPQKSEVAFGRTGCRCRCGFVCSDARMRITTDSLGKQTGLLCFGDLSVDAHPGTLRFAQGDNG